MVEISSARASHRWKNIQGSRCLGCPQKLKSDEVKECHETSVIGIRQWGFMP